MNDVYDNVSKPGGGGGCGFFATITIRLVGG